MTTFEQVKKDKLSTVYYDWFDEGVRCLIVRGPASLCAYFGIPIDHPLANKPYDDLPLDVHGGLTFSGEGEDKFRPKDFWWYGWDYGHTGDKSTYDSLVLDGKEWTPEEVKGEVENALWDFKKLMKLCESIRKP